MTRPPVMTIGERLALGVAVFVIIVTLSISRGVPVIPAVILGEIGYVVAVIVGGYRRKAG